MVKGFKFKLLRFWQGVRAFWVRFAVDHPSQVLFAQTQIQEVQERIDKIIKDGDKK